jgi:hypothetical protein
MTDDDGEVGVVYPEKPQELPEGARHPRQPPPLQARPCPSPTPRHTSIAAPAAVSSCNILRPASTRVFTITADRMALDAMRRCRTNTESATQHPHV